MGLIKGYIGEIITAINLCLWLDSKVYVKFHNVIIPGENGTAQIDTVIISTFGVFIVETKNKKGWIFGSAQNASWTQVIYRRKYTFQNPLRQTYRQKKVLAAFLGCSESQIYDVVYFAGFCRFRTPMPKNVLGHGLARYVKKFNIIRLSQEEFEELVLKMRNHIKNNTLRTSDHIRSLRTRFESATLCAKCGSRLNIRTSQQGPKAGSQFLGCSKYPRCKYTRDL
jgi:restriction system protein